MSAELILVEQPAAGVARIVLNRPQARNAQNLDFLLQLDAAFSRAAADDSVKVIILASNGPDFSSGHDMRFTLDMEVAERFNGAGAASSGGDGYMAREREIYIDMCWRWRDLPKPTIAAVQGRCIAGGLMLAWVCDLIVAADNALFTDPVVAMGVCGVEWFAHPWELGPRKAKELLFTGAAWDAAEAHRLGMVNHVVPLADLEQFTLKLAETIAQKSAYALRMTKEAVNSATDLQGQRAAIDKAFQLHHLCHYNNMQKFGSLGDPTGMPALAKKPASESK